MLKIDTDRLYILPLDRKNLELCIDKYDEMEKTLNLDISRKMPDERQKNVWRIRLNGVKSNPEKYMWYTVWVIVLKEINQIIGTIMLKNYPNENGEVIVGYVMHDDYRRNGFMIEALRSLIKWTFKNPDVKYIVADTLKSNTPSQNLLKKIEMVYYKEDDECYWWRLGR